MGRKKYDTVVEEIKEKSCSICLHKLDCLNDIQNVGCINHSKFEIPHHCVTCKYDRTTKLSEEPCKSCLNKTKSGFVLDYLNWEVQNEETDK